MAKYASSSRFTTLRPTIGWRAFRGTQEHSLDDRLLALLRGVARTGTLTAAAREEGIPYRTAWAVVEDAQREVGTPLVVYLPHKHS